MPKFTEAQLEEAIIELFQEQGYDYINGDKLHRKFDEVFLEDDMKSFLGRRYPDITKTELEKIINKIKHVPKMPLYMGNREAFYLVNEGFNLQRDDSSKGAFHIEYIDFETPENNIFKDGLLIWGRISKEMMDVMKKFPAGHPHAVTPERLARWEAASTHPDENDFKKAEEFFSDLLNK